VTPAISIVLPVHDQADHIGGVVTSYLAVLQRLGRTYEVLLVPNGCRDASVEICRGLERENEGIRVLELGAGGWGRAVRAGLDAAAGDTICYTNSARTTPEILALILSYATAYPEVVVKANRKIRDSWQRRLGSLLYNLECRALFDLPVWDINGTPKAFPRTFDGLLALRHEDDLIDVELVAECRARDYAIVEVPVLSTVRHGGASTTGIGSAVRMYAGVLRLKRERAAR
jgi:glycosyltransferase involved in cell wall biosynthesis